MCIFRRVLCSLFLLATFGAHAGSLSSVGPDTDCTYHKLQDAIKAIGEGSAGEIHVMAGTLVETEPLVIKENKVVRLYGGYAHCNDMTAQDFNPDLSTLSTVDGSKHTGNAAIAIHDSSDVDIRRFHLTKANNSGQNGGGIYFSSSGDVGHLLLQYVVIDNNTADKGAGIFFDGESAEDWLVLADYSWIQHNTANDAGGGIRIQGGVKMFMDRPNSTISWNTADPTNSDDGHGGGLQMLDTSVAYIGSPGLNGNAVIDHNNARYGGGISMHDNTTARLYMTQSLQPARVEHNTAVMRGGGVWMRGHANTLTYGDFSDLFLYFAGINYNTAGSGAAVYGESDPGAEFGPGPSGVYVRTTIEDLFDPIAADCPAGYVCSSVQRCSQGYVCNTVNHNTATDADGAVIDAGADNDGFNADATAILHNSGARILSQFDGNLSNCLIADNTLSQQLFTSNDQLSLTNCTIAGNSVSGTNLFDPPTGLQLSRTIVWQPGKHTVDAGVGGLSFNDDLLTDADTLNPANFAAYSNVLAVNPLFVNPQAENYQLQDFSLGIDGSISKDCNKPYDSVITDLIGNNRKVPLTHTATPCDIGAYERQSIPPGHFPSDLTEDFDTDLDAYALELPTGWISGTSGGAQGFFIVSDNVSTGAHSIHADDGASAGESDLISPTFEIGETATLTFDHFYSLETNYDGAILEISINGGAFEDIVAAGGAFVSGGYSGALGPTDSHNPIQEQCGTCMAWTGGNAGFTTVKVNLPHLAANTPVQLRWRVGSDQNYGTPFFYGYYLDHIHVDLNGNPDLIFANGFDN